MPGEGEHGDDAAVGRRISVGGDVAAAGGCRPQIASLKAGISGRSCRRGAAVKSGDEAVAHGLYHGGGLRRLGACGSQ